MNKEEFFYRPKSAKEILLGRDVYHADDDIAETVLQLEPHQGLVIPEIVPEDFASRTRFLKKGNQVVLDVGDSEYDALRRGITPKKAHKKAMDRLKPGQHCGMVWRSLRRNEYKRLTLDESLKGTKELAWTEISGNEIEATPYTSVSGIEFYGGKFKLWVPSRTQKQGRYEITAESVPINKSAQNNPVIWTDLTFTHSCGITGNDFSFRYVRSEDFCAHEVAGIEKLAQRNFMVAGDRVPYSFVPFPIPTKETVQYYNKLLSQAVVEYESEDKKKMRPLNKAEREILLWDFVRIMGYDASFGKKGKKILDYGWALPKAA